MGKNVQSKMYSRWTYLQVLFHFIQQVLNFPQFSTLLCFVCPNCRCIGQRTAANCKKAQNNQLHIHSLRSRYQFTKRCFSKDLLEMQTAVLLTFLYYPGGHRKTTCSELESLRNWCVWVMKFSFPLAATTTCIESVVRLRARACVRGA